MKAFEDYWDLTGLRGEVYYVPDAEEAEQYLVEHANIKTERAEGWKAALEWALQEVYEQDEDGFPNWEVEDWKQENLDSCYIPAKRIVEELNS